MQQIGLSFETTSAMSFTITRGRPMPFLDTLGNVLAIPNKLIFLNADFESHQIDEKVVEVIEGFATHHGLQDVRIRLNEYDPIGELGRLFANRRVTVFLRMTVGLLQWVAYCLNCGRLFGGDHYNPFSDTVNLYSSNTSIALHELGHVLDFRRVGWPGAYALIRLIPGVSLYQEYMASWYAVLYLRHIGDVDEEIRAYRLLFPAYSTYVFGALLEWFPSTLTRGLLLPVIAVGHVAGEVVARQRVDTVHAVDIGRQPDLDYATRMFSTTSLEGRRNWGTALGLALGSSLCGVLAPVGAWIGFAAGSKPRA